MTAAGWPAAPPYPTFRGESGVASVRILDGGAEAYPRMLAAIDDAHSRVHLEVYGFAPLGVGRDFLDALTRASRRRTKVRVVIDGFGTARNGRAIATQLRRSGCDVRIHNRLRAALLGRIGRMHRKLLLVDDAVAFVGGINIGDENLARGGRRGWADIALEIRGPECRRLGRQLRREPVGESPGGLRILLSGLGGGWRLRHRYLRAFAAARHRIDIAHGYFLPDAGILRAITAAARRGVRVRLLLAGDSDVPFSRMATRSLHRHLMAAGLEISEWTRSVLHAKVATIDDRRLLLGSFNLDPFSLANLESLVDVDDPDVVERAQCWMDAHFSGSHSVTAFEAGSRARRWFFDPVGRAIVRIAVAASRAMAPPMWSLATARAGHEMAE